MAASAARVLWVEDEPALLQMGCEYLSRSGYEVDPAPSLDSAQVKIKEQDYDAVITDIRMGDDPRAGIQILAEPKLEETPVLLVSGYADYSILKDAINLGADYFFEKPFRFEDLEGTLARLLKENTDSVEGKLLELSQSAGLTGRESEILSLLTKGLSNREIATATGTSERTVKAHLSSIFKKTRVSSRSELLSLFMPRRS